MKLHIISDIHLEFADMLIPEVDANITIIAGDLHTGIQGLPWIRKLGRPVIYVPGNHEYYGHDMDKVKDQLQQQKSAHALDNQALTLGDTTFFGSTLWTDFDYFGNLTFDMGHAKRYINDFRFIKYQSSRLTPENSVELHKESLAHIRSFMDKNIAKKVIITHHLPSAMSVHSKYKGDVTTSAFASNLDSIVFQSCAKLWIHGHTHESCDYRIGKTQVICNPRGYPPFNQQFNPNLVVEV